MKEVLEKLINLARDWRDFSLMSNGRQCMHYCDEMVWCYFADDTDHSAVHFKVRQFSFSWDEIQISFLSTPTVSGFTVRSAGSISDCIGKYSKLLEEEKRAYDKLNEKQKKAKKQTLVDSLEKQLIEAKLNN